MGRVGGIQSKNSIENTTSHNSKALKDLKTDFNMPRMNWLIHAVFALEKVNKNSKILSIGARTENEILLLHSLGFNSVEAVDLQSYSPLIQVGDMHKLNFPAGTFDVVFCGWTISYSRTPQIAAKEILRVTKSGGIIAIGLEHVPCLRQAGQNAIKRKDPLWEGLQKRVNSCGDIISLFGRKNIRHVYFNHDHPLSRLKAEEIHQITELHSSQVMCVFEKG
jgi:SAM-dependent methyltransferase